jgi:ABC-2 type transport system permease protein
MLQKLSIEWMKLKNYRTFWILGILYLVSIFGANFIVFSIQQAIYKAKEAKGMAEMVLGSTPYSFPSVWQTVANVSSFLLFIPGLLMIISMTNEYSYKTHRQNIIDGWTRQQYISIKISLAVILAFISTITVFLTALIFGFIDGGSSFDAGNMQYVAFYFLEAFSYIMVALLIAVLVKRGGLAIGIFFLYALILEELLVQFLNHYANYAGRYLPLQTTDLLTPFPTIQRMSSKLVAPPNIAVVLTLALVYLAGYIFLIKRKFETDDL